MIRMKIVILSILFSVGLWADSTALFGRVVNVAQNDTLNVRIEPNYKAKKVGEIPFGAYIGIEKCQTLGSSTWCHVYPLVQNWYENFGPEDRGWVNAQYLLFKNKGYVVIKGKKNSCFYALKCKNNESRVECLVVADTKTDSKYEIIELKTKWLDRALLRGESAFGSASNDMDGYCTWGSRIDDYLKKQGK